MLQDVACLSLCGRMRAGQSNLVFGDGASDAGKGCCSDSIDGSHHVMAGDLRPVSKAGPVGYTAPVFNWSGGYIGGVGSAGMFGTDMSDHWCFTAGDAPDVRKWGGALGGTLGYNTVSRPTQALPGLRANSPSAAQHARHSLFTDPPRSNATGTRYAHAWVPPLNRSGAAPPTRVSLLSRLTDRRRHCRSGSRCKPRHRPRS